MISTVSVAYAKRTKHPEFKDRTVEDVFQEGRSSFVVTPTPPRAHDIHYGLAYNI
jgi:hypothetical protein